ncbi:hypothetical protein T12_13548 [Trichinella patagoniensis]|uniref:Uncharacterized protein n=1 Tax=Trichinella patagoniensis TaxID=990121 RepID=A0A0V0Z3T6_9BILA|nr:hypothetical protein T12_13548 [Trichinella patagoniensis]
MQLKTTDSYRVNKHVNSGSSECTVILSVMYPSNLSGRSLHRLHHYILCYKQENRFVSGTVKLLKREQRARIPPSETVTTHYV